VALVIGELNKGGAEYQLHELLRHLDRRRVEPRLFALMPDGYWVEPIRRLGIPVEELPRRGSADPSRVVLLRRALRAFAPDVLHTILWSANVYGRLAALGLGIPVVIAAERNAIRRPRWQILVERVLDRMTDAYLVNADAVTAILVEHEGIPRAKVHVIRNGIDLAQLPAATPDRSAARAALGFDPGRRLIAQVGRLSAQKDYPTFLHAAAEVARAEPDTDFVVVGEGEDRPALEALARSLGIADRVRFTGVRNDVPAILGAVEVLALSSIFEGLPNVVLEAMAMGAVAVATDVGGCRELIAHEETGLLVAPRNPTALASALLRVLRDRPLAVRLAGSARRRVEGEFSLDKMARRTEAVYETLLARAGRGSHDARARRDPAPDALTAASGEC
jgi:glycosyltransferase involved in cell wall biosynthesis